MVELHPHTKNIITMVVGQICKTLGWNSISSISLQVLVDVFHRYLQEMCVTVNNYTNQYNHTLPTLEEILLTFSELGIKVEELDEYIQCVPPISINKKVPKYPIERKSNLNFLKPGSREVVTRPVCIHEYLPAMYPQLPEDEYQTQNSALTNSSPSDMNNTAVSSNQSLSLFKLSGDDLDGLSVNKRVKLEEGGKSLPRELTSVMMTSSGFLSTAREGKLPESRMSTMSFRFNDAKPSSPAIPPDVKVEHKVKNHTNHKSLNNANSKLAEKKIKDEPVNYIENGNEIKELKTKKSSIKESIKLKPSKFLCESPMLDVGKVLKVEKKKSALSETPVQRESKPVKVPKHEKGTQDIKNHENELEPNEEKLTMQPNKQKLSIFRRITKPKEDKSDLTTKLPKPAPEKPVLIENNNEYSDCLTELQHPPKRAKKGSIKNQKPYKEKTTKIDPKPKMRAKPALNLKMKVLENKVAKRSLLKSKGVKRKKKLGTSNVESKKVKRSKLKEIQEETELPSPEKETKPAINTHTQVPFIPLFSALPAGPGLIPSQNPLFPRFPVPFPNVGQLNPNGAHPAMPNLPLPPPTLIPPKVCSSKSHFDNNIEDSQTNPHPVIDKGKKGKKEHKKLKKDKKKKDKRDKLKLKEKKPKEITEKPKEVTEKPKEITEKNIKKVKTKNKANVKNEKTYNPIKVETKKEDPTVPKLKLKLSGSSSPQLSPSTSQSPKITIKPIIKPDSDFINDTKLPDAIVKIKPEQNPSPEVVTKVSKPVGRPPKQKRLLETVVSPAPKPIVEPITLNISTKNKKGSISGDITKATIVKEKSTIVKEKPTIVKEKPTIVKEKPTKSKKSIETNEPKHAPFYYDAEGNQVWVCPTCGAQDDGSPMIGCDGCDAWYHWVCVGIESPPDSAKWFCSICARK